MRTLLLAALSLSAFTPSRDADACGGSYDAGPRVLRLSTHFVPNAKGTDRVRTFVLFGEANPGRKLTWEMLAPMSYDGTQIATDRSLDRPITFTLVGPSGTKVVTGKQHFYLSRSWTFKTPTSAVEIDAGTQDGFSVAIEGKAEAAWIELESTTPSKKTINAWVKAQGVTPLDPNSIYVSRVKGTDFEAVSVYPKNGDKRITLIKYNDRNLGKVVGSPMGGLVLGAENQLVIADGATTRLVDLGPAYLDALGS